MNHLVKAIDNRISRRTYIDNPVDSKKIEKLFSLVDKYNQEGKLQMELIVEGGDAFSKLSRSYGFFKNVHTILAMKGKTNDSYVCEKLGFYGELLVLEATLLGLGTCWVGGSFDRKSQVFHVEKDEILPYVITVGECLDEKSFREKLIHGLSHQRSTKVEDLIVASGNINKLPIEFIEAMKAVHKAPSAMNSQPVRFEYTNGEVYAHHKNPSVKDSVDLGIAKAHFIVKAGGSFEWGNGGKWLK
ncbi:MAG: Nitroreductase family protein [Bacillales bacterium]|nr:Nitroreductase family protein [Bacillales bacterium]